MVGRLAFVYPAEGERFFLRLLLINVQSPTSFEYLRTVNVHVCDTFQEANLKLGLVEDDDIDDLCMSEAKESQLPVFITMPFCNSTSGIAAANIPSRRTTHLRFKIPVDIESSLACDVPKHRSLAALIKETTLIIWDEASMENKSNLESLDLMLQYICENKDLFGGKLGVLGGDFC
ncbi:uncharacterized protein LOC110690157 [Chenopodium quinoa]|uniref:uncharacterized protein LOC110690157 n=1 Tax=Chenopodium quinoa TaxID=63459 RepID=UPI000B796E7D|nr:uncharacterized protein LOC110690157 [Chenopodium quinoa]